VWVRRIVLPVAALALSAVTLAPAAAGPVVAWHRAPAFSVQAAATDRHGHVYVAGFAPRGQAQYFGQPYELLLAKFTADGTRVWSRSWRSQSKRFPHAMAFDVSVSPNGRDVYVAGGIMIDSTEAGMARVWAYSSAGRLRWTRQTSAVGRWLSASATDTGLIAGAGSIAAWTRAGEQRWLRPFLSLTGDLCYWADDVAVGPAGDIFAVGLLDRDPTCNDSEGGDLKDADIVIQRRSDSGTVRWQKVLADPSERDVDQALGVTTAGSALYAAGVDDGRAWLARVTPRGRFVWTRRWGSRARAVDVSVAPWGPVYALSHVGNTIVLRSFTPETGASIVRWRRSAPTDDAEASAVATDWGRALYVAASRSYERGDLWRLRPEA
jgi:hypothetical protein